MGSQHLFLVSACLLFGLQVGFAQAPSSAPITTTSTFAQTENLQTTLNTAAATYTGNTATEVYPTTAADTSMYYGYAYNELPTQALEVVTSHLIDVTDVPGPPLCMFPTSGTWSLLPRIVFYCTIVFALVAKAHDWLIAGALGVALTYSALAALQVAFQVWTHNVLAEMDFMPMTGILAASCIIVVPLMNWSSTIQNLGLSKKQEDSSSSSQERLVHPEGDEKKEYPSTRTVLVFWGLLVAIGFLSAFVAIQYFAREADWISVFVTPPFGTQITCTPLNGTLDTTAGQLPGWQYFWITAEFVKANNCNDPCSFFVDAPLFRSPDEIQLQGMSTVDLWFEGTKVSANSIRNFHFIVDYFGKLLFVLPLALLQAVLHVAIFWRYTPQKARWRVFLWFAGIEEEAHLPKPWSSRVKFGFGIATFFYSCSLLILIITPVAFIINVINTEIFMWYIPQSETNAHVDQWGVFAVAIMVLIAAVICRLTPDVHLAWDGSKLAAKQKYFMEKLKCLHEHSTVKPHFKNEPLFKRLKEVQKYNSEALACEYRDLKAKMKYKYKDIRALLAYELFTWKTFLEHPEKKPVPRKKTVKKNVDVPKGYYGVEEWCPPEWPDSPKRPERAEHHRIKEEEIHATRKELRRIKEEVRKAEARDKTLNGDLEAGQYQKPVSPYYDDSASSISIPVPSLSQASTRASPPVQELQASPQRSIPRKPVRETHFQPDSRPPLVRSRSSSGTSHETYELSSGDTTPFLSPQSSTWLLQSEPLHTTLQQAPTSSHQTTYPLAGRPHSPSYFSLQDQESNRYPTEPEPSARSFIDDRRW